MSCADGDRVKAELETDHVLMSSHVGIDEGQGLASLHPQQYTNCSFIIQYITYSTSNLDCLHTWDELSSVFVGI